MGCNKSQVLPQEPQKVEKEQNLQPNIQISKPIKNHVVQSLSLRAKNISYQQQINTPRQSNPGSAFRKIALQSTPQNHFFDSDIQDLIGQNTQDINFDGTFELNRSQSINESLSPTKKPLVNARMQLTNDRKIHAMNIQIGEVKQYFNYVKTSKKPQQQDIQFIVKSFQKIPFFFSLEEHQLKEIVTHMFHCTCKKNQYLFKQNDYANAFFLIIKGSVAVEVEDTVKKVLESGSGVGELALLYNSPRSASIKCLSDVEFWAIQRQEFKQIIEQIINKDFESNLKFLEQVQFFQSLSECQKNAIARVFITQKFNKNDIICQEGDISNSFFIIKQGQVSLWKGQQKLRICKVGDSFGEQSLIAQKAIRAATVKADEDCLLLSLGKQDVSDILGGQVQKILLNNSQRQALENNKIISQLTSLQIEKVLNCMKIQKYQKGTVLFEKNDFCDQIFAVLQGRISTEDGRSLAEKREVFGEQYIQDVDQSIKFNDRIVIPVDSILGSITFKLFFKAIGGSFKQIIQKNKTSHETQIKKLLSEKSRIVGKDKLNTTLNDLIYIKKLGQGQFGTVYLVKNKNTGDLYALKSLEKAQIQAQKLQKFVIQEKQVLEQLNFPLIMSYIKPLKDVQCLYFLLGYIQGLDLFDVIRKIGLLSTFDSQFYAACMILILEYLHAKLIVYRDLKPENMVVDPQGYLYLIDMGASKFLKKGERTFTIIGTPHYMAPEVIKGKGYSFQSDLWSVGIVTYEFMCGNLPFGDNIEDPYQIYEEIMNTDELKFPHFFKDEKGKKFICQLLNTVPELRLGGSFSALKTCGWFNGFDWDQLFNKEMEAPFIPNQADYVNDKFIQKMVKKEIGICEEIAKNIKENTDNFIELDQYF